MSNEDAPNNPSPAVLELLAKVPPEVLSGLVSAVANAHSSNKDSTSTAALTASTVAMTAGPSSPGPHVESRICWSYCHRALQCN
jgi:hypothetical protein